MNKSLGKALYKSHKQHLWQANRLSKIRFPSMKDHAHLLEHKFRATTKCVIVQQKAFSTVKHLELLAKYKRGTRQVENFVVRALEPTCSETTVKTAVKESEILHCIQTMK